MRILLITGKLFVNDERSAIGRRDSGCFYDAITGLEIFIYMLLHIYNVASES